VEQASPQAGTGTEMALSGLASFLTSDQTATTLPTAEAWSSVLNAAPGFLMTRTASQPRAQFADVSLAPAEEDEELEGSPVTVERAGETTLPRAAGAIAGSARFGEAPPPPVAVARPARGDAQTMEPLDAAFADLDRVPTNAGSGQQDESLSPYGDPTRGRLLTVIGAAVTALGAYWAARTYGRPDGGTDGWPVDA